MRLDQLDKVALRDPQGSLDLQVLTVAQDRRDLLVFQDQPEVLVLKVLTASLEYLVPLALPAPAALEV